MKYKSNTLKNALDEDNYNNLKLLLDVIQPSLIVGGAVRNALLDIKIKDIDIATGLSPQMVMDRVVAARMKCVDTGLEHGTVTVIVNSCAYEVTTLRKDVKTYGRKAEVEFMLNDAQSPGDILDLFAIDASRRDLTINAMYADLDDNIYDFFGGMEDLRDNLVRFIGEPAMRIQEDYLRILRFFRFSCYYAQKFDANSLQACYDNADGLRQISAERWTMEIVKILQHHAPWNTLRAMDAVLKAIGISAVDFATTNVSTDSDIAQDMDIFEYIRKNEAKFGRHSMYEARLAMFDGINKLKLSSREQRLYKAIKYVCKMDLNNENDMAIWAIMSDNDEHFWSGVIFGDTQLEMSRIEYILRRANEFDISGNDLLELGYAPGKEIGEMLRKMHVRYCLSECTRGELLNDAAQR